MILPTVLALGAQLGAQLLVPVADGVPTSRGWAVTSPLP